MSVDIHIQKLKQEAKRKDIEEHPWKEEIIRDDKGKVINNIQNYLTYYSRSDKYKDKFKYNEFLQQKEFNNEYWDDLREAQAIIDVEMELSLSSADKARRAIDGLFNTQRYNPVQDYLNSLKWDGEKRIEEIFIKCFSVDDTELVRALSKKWFIAAVKRVFEPGCQFDNMIVLQGPTGIGKTTFCRLLSNNFYSEIKFDEIGNKDIVDKLNKSWIAIIDEMDNFGTKGMASIKSFLSVKKDVVRLAYARNTNVYQRHCIFIGSLNDETFLKDITTSVERRFWIFKCNREGMGSYVSDILTQDMVDQLWAESMFYYNDNPNIYLDVDINLQKEFAEDQLQYKAYNNDIAIDYVNEILNKPYVLVDGNFNDDTDFLNQYRGETVYTGQKTYINKIKMSSVIYVLKEVYHQERTGKYIGGALSAEWEYKNVKTKDNCGKSHTPFFLVRKKINEQVIDNEEVNDLPI